MFACQVLSVGHVGLGSDACGRGKAHSFDWTHFAPVGGPISANFNSWAIKVRSIPGS